MRFIVLMALVAPTFVQAGVVGETVHYVCDRGGNVYATYVGTEDESSVILAIEGQQVALAQQEAASGSKFAPPEGQPGYIWWTKGDAATLYSQGATSNDDIPLGTCAPVQ